MGEPQTGFYLHPASPLHDPGWGHPEHQGRLRALASAVGKDLLAVEGLVRQRVPREASEEDLARVHTTDYIDLIRRSAEQAQREGKIVELDPDTRVSGASWDAAVGSAGAALQAVEDIAEGLIANAFVATRPPGHHASADRAMGFCLFNAVAVAARGLQAAGHAQRVLIVDWDVHHGNGTQDIFYRDGSVFYLSLHQSPHWPGTGSAAERGQGEGEGTTLNVPLPAGIRAVEYRDHFGEALEAAVEGFEPDFLLVSAGFDVMAGDPLGGQMLEPADMHALTLMVLDLAMDKCAGRLALLLEGGYEPRRTGMGAVAVIRALAGVPPE